jgi:hypothetical protein
MSAPYESCVERVKGLIQSLSRCSGALQKHEERSIYKLAEVCKVTLRSAANDVVTAAHGLPLLSSHSADSTPTALATRLRACIPDGPTSVRRGRQGVEFLVRNQFIRCLRHDGSTIDRAIVDDPVHLSEGKSAPAIFELCLRSWKSLRSLGHSGVAIEHYAFDRCGYEMLSRLFRGWHKVNASMYDQMSTLPSDVFRMTELVVSTACALHDAQNAYRWAVVYRFDDKDILKDAYITCEALRHSTDIFMRRLGEWLVVDLKTHPDLSSEEREHMYEIWTALGIDAEMATKLAYVLQLKCDGRTISVASSCLGMADLHTLLINTLLYIWKFRRWNEGRFLNVGRTCRVLVIGVMTGLELFFKFLDGRKEESMFYLNGFRRLLKEDRKAFIATSAIVSFVPEAVLTLLLKDSRVMHQYANLWETLSQQMLWLVSLPAYFWEAVAGSVDMSAEELKSNCINGGHVSFHFFWRRVLQPASEAPWCLCFGDVKANVEELRDGPEPSELVSWQLWCMLRAGISENIVMLTIILMKEIPWTTLPAEQQHGVMAALHRFHPDYAVDMLAARTMISLLRRMLWSMSKEHKALVKVSRKISKLKRKHPWKASGRHAFASDLFALARTRNLAATAKQTMVKQVIKHHCKRWWLRTPLVRQMYHRRAQLAARQKQAHVANELQQLRSQKSELTVKLESDSMQTKAMNFGQCVLEDKHLAMMSTLMEGGTFSERQVRELRADAMTAPKPTDDLSKKRYEALGRTPSVHPIMPQWARDVASRREYFRDCIFVLHLEGGVQYWKFLYAVQSPIYLAVTRLQRRVHYRETREVRGDTWASLNEEAVRYKFACNYADHANAADMPEIQADSMHVITNAMHVGGTTVVARSASIPFLTYIDRVPEPVKKRADVDGNSSERRKRSHDADDLPWLHGRLNGFDFWEEAAKPPPPPPCPGGDNSDAESDLSLDDEALEQALDELHAARAGVLDDAPEDEYDGFRVTVLGGKWLKKHTGKSYDAVKAACRGASAESFCDRRGVHKSARFTVAYGMLTCGVLARAWCSRMQFFYNWENVQPDGEALPITPAIALEYQEPDEFVRLAESTMNADVIRRIEETRGLFCMY